MKLIKEAVNQEEETTTTTEQRGDDETDQRGGGETSETVQGVDDSSKLGAEEDGCEATPSAGSRTLEGRPVRPWKDANQSRGENDCTLEIGNVDSPRRDENNADECSQEGVDVEEVEEAMVADDEEKVADEADNVEL